MWFSLCCLHLALLAHSVHPKKKLSATPATSEVFPGSSPQVSRTGLIIALIIVGALFLVALCSISYVCIKSVHRRHHHRYHALDVEQQSNAAVISGSPEMSPRIDIDATPSPRYEQTTGRQTTLSPRV
eukprot:Gregarina_sp_Pseudo_9__5204@NODE_572_length_2559_cov_26_754365_g541_i0_p3_GENE_NODE_572_length_2559_cov_26_754365_g541_i0NODE_572_length_2559_cov_26_754365_g541_i0_p3_ORF_typecomplete_len128_score24_29Herpes_gE/PF02480_16/0_00012PRIMA1/PF16101_5/0_0015PRIMA1/PF16101_5/3_5e03Adeno_E3B/PF03376_14/0_013Cadherin_C_2/PF16492_5/0_0084CYYR1/PF10873_8/0_02CD34_antigen/PF06365_12/0_02TMEM52/PF14979_6/2_3e03TMEM52/PF14979_6/0_025TMEM52/PF14979_6/2_8e03Shisa/PF13908_6/0_056WBP1/PF11669_8/5_8e03WBP1/PF11669